MQDSSDISLDMEHIIKASTSISQQLAELPREETKCHIYRVYDHLRNLNPGAYTPLKLAIGPYHHGAPETLEAQKRKVSYLRLFLKKTKLNHLDCLLAIGEIELKARSCYANDLDCTKAQFVEMMLLDGCFIIVLLLKCEERISVGDDDIFQTHCMLTIMKRDLLLFENQIPFFVLCKLFNMFENSFYRSKNPYQESVRNYKMLSGMFFRFFSPIIGDAGYILPTDITSTIDADYIKHLLHLIHIFWCPASSYTSHPKPVEKKPWLCVSAVTKRIWCPASLDTSHQKPVIGNSWRFVSAATKLRDANVKFERNDDQGASLFNVTFENGILKLYHFQIEDITQDLFRNLIAYEQYFPMSEQHDFATDYMIFLDTLIDSPGDVEILRQHRILESWLSSDEVISNIINGLTGSVTISSNFAYAGVLDAMNEHCKKRKNKWMAMLKRNYLRSPWAILSLIAAVVLLLLTLVQAVCSVLQLTVFKTSGN